MVARGNPVGGEKYNSRRGQDDAERFKRLEDEIKRLRKRIDELELATSPHVLAGYYP